MVARSAIKVDLNYLASATVDHASGEMLWVFSRSVSRQFACSPRGSNILPVVQKLWDYETLYFGRVALPNTRNNLHTVLIGGNIQGRLSEKLETILQQCRSIICPIVNA